MRVAAARSKPVAQFTINGELVKKWPSAVEAHRQIGVDARGIGRVCKNERATAGGFVWKFVIDLQGGM